MCSSLWLSNIPLYMYHNLINIHVTYKYLAYWKQPKFSCCCSSFINWWILKHREQVASLGIVIILIKGPNISLLTSEWLRITSFSSAKGILHITVFKQTITSPGAQDSMYTTTVYDRESSLVHVALGLCFGLPPNILPNTLCALLASAKVLGIYGGNGSRVPEFKGILFTWFPLGSFRKESITEKIWEIFYWFKTGVCHRMAKV